MNIKIKDAKQTSIATHIQNELNNITCLCNDALIHLFMIDQVTDTDRVQAFNDTFGELNIEQSKQQLLVIQEYLLTISYTCNTLAIRCFNSKDYVSYMDQLRKLIKGSWIGTCMEVK